MKIWVISDTHLGQRNGNKRWQAIANDCYDKFMMPLFREKASNGDVLVHCGDVFDNRQSINIGAINDAVRWFEGFSDTFSCVYVLCGNHDTRDVNSTDVSSLECLKHIKGVNVIKTQKREKVGGAVVNFVPWQNDDAVLKEWLGIGGDYTFCHAEVYGAKMNYSGVRSEHGVRDLSVKNIYSGHIHYRQSHGNVVFVGSPYAMTMGDVGNDKGVYSIDLSTGEVEFHKNNVSPTFVKIKKADFAGDVESLSRAYANKFVEIAIDADDINDTAFVRLVTAVGELGEVCDIRMNVAHSIIEDAEVKSGWDNGESVSLNEMMGRYVRLTMVNREEGEVDEVLSRCGVILDRLGDVTNNDISI